MNYKLYTNNENKTRAICLGYFDGIHLGHQELIKKTVEEAKKYNLVPTLLTFDPDPSFVLGFKNKNELIMPLSDRFKLVKELGIEDIVVLTFDNESMNLEPNEFIDYLLNTLHVKNITVGFDFSFGKKGKGKVNDLKLLEPNIKINVIEELKINDKKVSSSFIIQDIKEGKVNELDKTLGMLYSVKGKVIRGLGNGKKLSFPTLNLEFFDEYVIPKKGVYGVNVKVNDKEYLGMANIGTHPSISELDKDLLEVHLFNFNEDIYGLDVTCTFLYYIREEKKFDSLDELINQLKLDKELIIKKSGDKYVR